MATEEFVEQLLAAPDSASQRLLLEDHAGKDDGEISRALKAEADRLLRSNVQRSLDTVELINTWAELNEEPADQALGLLAEANVYALGLGDYHRAIGLYDQAADIYRQANMPVEEARSAIGKVAALGCIGRYEEAAREADQAETVLVAHNQLTPLTSLTMNMAVNFARKGADREALAKFDQAASLYQEMGEQGETGWLWTQLNRSHVLRNLGQFDAAIDASTLAWQRLDELHQPVAAARARQNLAMTFFVLGRYNEALEHLDHVSGVFLADGRERDAMLVELFASNCLIQLRRYADVRDRCLRVRDLFVRLGAPKEVGQAIVNEALAYAGLGRFGDALDSLEEARHIFAASDNKVWAALTDIETASILRQMKQYETSQTLALDAAAVLAASGHPVRQAHGLLVAARSALAQDSIAEGLDLADRSLRIGEENNIPALQYQGHHLRGLAAAKQGRLEDAIDEYKKAIAALEQLRGRIMIEFRADFQGDKQAVYEELVDLGLENQQPELSLEYAERAKSRALIDMLAFRLDLSIEARNPGDAALITELQRLREKRDLIVRQWQVQNEIGVRGGSSGEDTWQDSQQDVLELEKQITSLWHKLLIRNADYARDAALWQIRAEPIQPFLPAETILVEYFSVKNELVVFLVTQDAVEARRLGVKPAQIQQLLRLLQLNFGAVLAGGSTRIGELTRNAQGLLKRAHDQLYAPIQALVEDFPRHVIVPHGPLHYLPFHALFDGTTYLVENHEISYLPGASLLRYSSRSQKVPGPTVACAHSLHGRLPHTLAEARSVAAQFDGQLLLEDQALVSKLKDAMRECQIVHIAAHGDFRPDNPLFSGIALEDSWLTTLDIFNQRVQASLVTLSACQTGRSAIAGGDELLGLMRAFLYAGAASLLLTLWTVEDSATARFMENFYGKLADGFAKGAALRQAQREFFNQQLASVEDGIVAHPYFWAPFFLVGDPGAL
ncbi:MAG: CHAT domain-containing tetratricopeptide repeat protein [Chloroflexota bacterium]|nr:CHAT domain-containing tetratricopeptide repeat protein [Chloroflexota bacterium]